MEEKQFCLCLRCGHKWTSRAGVPSKCPLCQSQFWNMVEIPERLNQRIVGKRGSSMKHPEVGSLEPGKEIFVAFKILENGERDPHDLRNMARSINVYAKRAGWKVFITSQARGLNIYRIS